MPLKSEHTVCCIVCYAYYGGLLWSSDVCVVCVVGNICSCFAITWLNSMNKKEKLPCLFCLALYIVILLPLAWLLKPFLIQDTCCCHLLSVLFSVLHSALLCERLMRNSQMGLNSNLLHSSRFSEAECSHLTEEGTVLQ